MRDDVDGHRDPLQIVNALEMLRSIDRAVEMGKGWRLEIVPNAETRADGDPSDGAPGG